MPPHDPYAVFGPELGFFEPSPRARLSTNSSAKLGFYANDQIPKQSVLEGRYDESILSVDRAVGELLQWLKLKGTLDQTMVILSADHGESFGHNYGGHGGPLLTEDLVRVPLIIKPPLHKGMIIVKEPYEQIDIAPTILKMADLTIPWGMEGCAYPTRPTRQPVFTMNRDMSGSKPTINIGMRSESWKYVAHFGSWAYPWPQRELYDLERDPNEHNNLVGRRPDIAAVMHQRILGELAMRGVKPGAP